MIIPPEIQVTNIGSAQNTCKSVRKLDGKMKCYFSTVKNGEFKGQYQVIIEESVPRYGLYKNAELSFRIARGLKTPISTKTTSSFQISFTDEEHYEINFVRKAMTLTMRDGCDIGPLDVQPKSEIVGATTVHTLLFNTPVPLSDGYFFYVIIPDQCQPPQHH